MRIWRDRCDYLTFDWEECRIKSVGLLDRRQAVRHWVLVPAFAGSNPAGPATMLESPIWRFFVYHVYVIMEEKEVCLSCFRRVLSGGILGVLACALIVMAPVRAIEVTYPYYGFVEDPEEPWEDVWSALEETGTVEYEDAYFAEESFGEHPELRVVSYALALAGYENLKDGYTGENGVAYAKLHRMLGDMGFGDIKYWDERSEEDGHSFGTTIARKTIEVDGGARELVVVAPRNYNYLTEWLSNFNVGVAGDHAGFSESAGLVTTRLGEYLDERGLSDVKIWMVGYSRGGAVIDLAAKTMNEDLERFGVSEGDLYAYTFGAPRASLTETKYRNIHDVKDGNDLLLGYLFPEAWGFYNTGVYEEIHAADLDVTGKTIEMTNLRDPAQVLMAFMSNEGVVVDEGAKNGKEFMDEWLAMVTEAGLTREYFDTEVKPALSKLMKAYQMRKLDEQSEFTGFITSQENGMLGMIAGNGFSDLMAGGYGASMEEAIANFPVYKDLRKVLEGTAETEDFDELATELTRYMGVYSDYENRFGDVAVTEEEFATIREAVPELIRALGPILTADARATKATFGEDYSMYYLATLVANAEQMVVGHIPESIMPILKSLVQPVVPKVPNTGRR